MEDILLEITAPNPNSRLAVSIKALKKIYVRILRPFSRKCISSRGESGSLIYQMHIDITNQCRITNSPTPVEKAPTLLKPQPTIRSVRGVMWKPNMSLALTNDSLVLQTSDQPQPYPLSVSRRPSSAVQYIIRRTFSISWTEDGEILHIMGGKITHKAGQKCTFFLFKQVGLGSLVNKSWKYNDVG